MQKLLEVVEIWLLLNLATFAFIMWYRRPNWTRRIKMVPEPQPAAEDSAAR